MVVASFHFTPCIDSCSPTIIVYHDYRRAIEELCCVTIKFSGERVCVAHWLSEGESGSFIHECSKYMIIVGYRLILLHR